MEITKTYNWNRRDFSFDATCEHCGNVETNCSGYDDANYYQNVIPDRKCNKCLESSNSKDSGELKKVNIPRYPEHQTL